MFGLLKNFFESEDVSFEKKSKNSYAIKPKKQTRSIRFEEIENINVKFQKHQFSKSIKITLKSYNCALVTMPKRCSFSDARIFVHKNLDWLKTNFEKFETKKPPKKAEIEQLRKRAKEILPKKVEELAKKYGFKYKNLRFKNSKTRWGSCSWNNNINLNLNLVLLDDELIEYVILHELTHTIVKNHSEKFWQLLCKYLPNAFELRKQLKTTKL